jgi:hypothetical protein
MKDAPSDVTPLPPSDQPSKKNAGKAKNAPPKVQRPQTAEKKSPTSDTIQVFRTDL